MANYAQKKRRAAKLIKKHGAQFEVERDGRKVRGFAVEDSKLTENRADLLDTTKRGVWFSTIELRKGDLIKFRISQEVKQIDTVIPLQPDGGVIIYWECEAVS